MKNSKKLLPMNLQFFANDSAENENDGNEDNGTDGAKKTDESAGGESKEEEEKTFTQSQVSAMMTKEKKEGKMSILKSLGFATEKDAKDAIALLNALKNSQKTEDEKLEDVKNEADDKVSEAEARAIAAESKLTCLENGVDKDCLDDVMAIAASKVSDDKSLESVIKEMKKDSRYAAFFVGKDKGTGRTPGNNQDDGKDNNGGYGKDLASKATKMASSGEQKSSYFN